MSFKKSEGSTTLTVEKTKGILLVFYTMSRMWEDVRIAILEKSNKN